MQRKERIDIIYLRISTVAYFELNDSSIVVLQCQLKFSINEQFVVFKFSYIM